MFVLASISRGGLHSLYELQRGVGLQPGGIQPVLRRLERDGLVKRAPQERRRRRLITVTAEGERVLNAEWHHALRDYPDPESVLRAATIATLMGDREAAKGYLRGIASVYEQGVPSPPSGGSDQKPQSRVELYAFMRLAWEAARRRCCAEVFRQIARKMEELEMK